MASGLISSNQQGIQSYSMPSVFDSLIEIKDYLGSKEISEEYSASFTSPGLQGWAHASKGFAESNGDAFFKASEHFLSDIDDNVKPGQVWSAVNKNCWGPYFHSRGHMNELMESPSRSVDIIHKANPVRERFILHIPEVSRYFNILDAAQGLINGDKEAITTSLNTCTKELRRTPEDKGFILTHDFLEELQNISQRTHGDHWISHLTQLVTILDRIPGLTNNEKANVISSLNVAVPNPLIGFEMGWEYGALESITDERILHRVMLAVFRGEAKAPYFSQIRHGPLEYGKDIVICRDVDGRKVNYFYSFKVGQVKITAWRKDIEPQLRDVFQVKFDSPEYKDNIDNTVGVLLWNDHLSPQVEPVISRWIKEQKDVFGNNYELMNIDDIVNHIRNNNLSGLLRNALRTEGLL